LYEVGRNVLSSHDIGHLIHQSGELTLLEWWLLGRLAVVDAQSRCLESEAVATCIFSQLIQRSASVRM
jgi:hypothetical protein